jgi:predicted ATPase
MISDLKIEGFKSFGPNTPPISLRALNFIVGANASGKTNLISSLKFLKLALLQNVEFAVGEFDGPTEVRNKTLRERVEAKPLRIEIKLDQLGISYGGPKGRQSKIKSMNYEVSIDLRTSDIPIVQSEKLTVEFTGPEGTPIYRMKRSQHDVEILDPVANKDNVQRLTVPKEDATRLVAGTAFISIPCVIFRNYVQGWSFFNINPDAARAPAKETPDVDLGSAGEHLAVILHKMEKQNGHRALETILDGLRGAVPGFHKVRTRQLPIEGKWAFQVVENRIRGAINPRSVSDGTIRLLAILVIAHWSARKSTLVAIEEPENGLHPHLSKNIVELMRTASEHRQVIVTTHNPDFLDFLQPEEVILCDKVDGITKVKHASDVAEIETFRKRFRLGELWEQGTLGGIP